MVAELGRVVILGAGALGTLVGAYLLKGGLPVIFIGRPGSIEALQAGDLVLERPWHRPYLLPRVRAASGLGDLAPRELADVSLVVLTTKVHDTALAVADLASYLPLDVPLLVLQNGVGGVELAREQIGARPLIAGTATLVASRPAPGVVRNASRRGGVGVASVTAVAGTLERSAFLLASGLPVRTYTDYRAMVWSKLLLNILGNALPAIVARPPERVFADLALCRLEVAAFREALAVMRAQGLAPVSLPGWPVPLIARLLDGLPLTALHRLLPYLVAHGRGGKPPSLQVDLERGLRESEVEYLNGAVVRTGRELGVAVPANALIYRTLSAMAQGSIPRDAYVANPHSLLAPLR